MKLDIEVISTDTIKPSSPTPNHLRRHGFSFVDQITPSIFMPCILFYHKDARAHLSNEECQERIKKSLSECLTRFYPLAGRIKDDVHVDCNDEGVPYMEAKVKCSLSEFLEDPDPAENIKFLPYELDDENETALAIQFNSFNCGGLAIGVVFAHKVEDASSFILFLNSWAAIARGSGDTATPIFEGAKIFPPADTPLMPIARGTGKENLRIKRFVFDESALASLRAKYTTDDPNIEYPRPTRVEALSAFIYNRYLAATQPEMDPNKIYSIFSIVNLRSRMDPPLSDNYFGNMSVSVASPLSMDDEDDFHNIVIPVRDAIKKVDKNYAKDLVETGGYPEFIMENVERFMNGEVTTLAITSLCRFPLYEADFGWGKPVWIASARLLYSNLITFFDTRSGRGIEVWINLEEEEMAKFEVDKELLALISSSKVSVD